MEEKHTKTVDLLLNKATEAFMMAIEIYNKPSIKYRVEGFALFICNAWELMLKAHLIKKNGMDSIYYKYNANRTLSLENCIEKVFTNNKDPLRKNLEKIIELRNTSTHFITEEYEMVYIPLFQACVLNFSEKIEVFHNIDMTSIIPQNFLTLSVSMKSLNEKEIIAKYPDIIANKILNSKDTVDDLVKNNNNKFAISINHYLYFTKDKDKATNTVAIDNKSSDKIQIVTKLKDPNVTHTYTANSCIDAINNHLKKKEIKPIYKGDPIDKINPYHFRLFCSYYGLKENDKYCYVHKQFSNFQYSYSQQVIDFIITEIINDLEVIDNIKNKLTPGAKEF